jgi:adenylyl cyclase-associated protein
MSSPPQRRQSTLPRDSVVQPPPSLTYLLRRLEAATSRLEDIASSVPGLDPNNAATSTSHLNGTPILSVHSTPSVTPTPAVNVQAASPAPPEDLPKEIEDFDKIINGELASFMKVSEMDPALVELATALKTTLQEERTILYVATKAKKPVEGSKEYIALYDGMSKNMMAINDIQDKNKNMQLKNHMALVADAAQALTWIAIDNKPADYLGELFGGAQIWGNNILRAYKDKLVRWTIGEIC